MTRTSRVEPGCREPAAGGKPVLRPFEYHLWAGSWT